MNQKYTKEERLKEKKNIDLLFEKGIWENKYPLKCIYLTNYTDNDSKIRFGVSVSKRLYKKAVDRNRIKRLLRECFRLNKDKAYSILPGNSLVMLIYVSKEVCTYKEMESKYIQILGKISKKTLHN